MLQTFRDTEACSPAEASEFNDTHSFCGLAVFGRVDRAALRPFCEGQYCNKKETHHAKWWTTDIMCRIILFYDAVMKEPPRREPLLFHTGWKPLVVASDVQVEPDEVPGGGVLNIRPRERETVGLLLRDRHESYQLWGASHR